MKKIALAFVLAASSVTAMAEPATSAGLTVGSLFTSAAVTGTIVAITAAGIVVAVANSGKDGNTTTTTVLVPTPR